MSSYSAPYAKTNIRSSGSASSRGQKGVVPKRLIYGLAFAALVVVTPLVYRQRPTTDLSIDLQVAMKLGVWVVCAICIVTTPRTLRLANSIQGLAWVLWALIVTVLLPLSSDPTISAAYTFSIITCLFFPFVVADKLGETKTVVLFVAAAYLFCLASLLVHFVDPQMGRMQEWEGKVQFTSPRLGGFGGHPNVMGHVAGYTVLVALFYQRKIINYLSPPIFISGLVIAIICLLMTNSRTTIIATGVTVGIWYGLRTGHFWKIAALTIVGLLAYVGLFTTEFNSIMRQMSRSGSSAEIEQLNGRDTIWTVVWNYAWQRPLTGWGMGTSLRILPNALISNVKGQTASYGATHAHNLFLQMFFSCGIAGFFATVLAFSASFWEAIRIKHNRVLCLLAFMMIVGLTEPAPFLGFALFDNIVLGMIVGIITLNVAGSSRSFFSFK